MSAIDWILILLIALAVTAAVVAMIRRKRQGKSCTCGGDCSSCAGGCGKGRR